MEVHRDNQATISIAKDPVHHERIKHVDIDRQHFIKVEIENKCVSLNYIFTKMQIADILAKALFKNTFEVLKVKLDLINLYNPT